MPHKNRRDKSKDSQAYDLPPTKIAKPLPVVIGSKPSRRIPHGQKRTRADCGKASKGFGIDDTPKAFLRLMQAQTTGRFPSGLDDGSKGGPNTKKRKRDVVEGDSAQQKDGQSPLEQNEPPQILPGEKMSDFAARVNAALPLSGLTTKGGAAKDVPGIKPKLSKREKKVQKMQQEWRKDEERRREKVEEVREEYEDLYGDDNLGDRGAGTGGPRASGRKGKKSKRGARGKDEDPWEVVKRARNEGPRRLHDVVQAPPKFTATPRQAFHVANGARVEVADVPKTAGSLRKREELGMTRKNILEGYRRMMAGKRIVDV